MALDYAIMKAGMTATLGNTLGKIQQYSVSGELNVHSNLVTCWNNSHYLTCTILGDRAMNQEIS